MYPFTSVLLSFSITSLLSHMHKTHVLLHPLLRYNKHHHDNNFIIIVLLPALGCPNMNMFFIFLLCIPFNTIITSHSCLPPVNVFFIYYLLLLLFLAGSPLTIEGYVPYTFFTPLEVEQSRSRKGGV